MELGERAALPAGTASEPAGKASEPAGGPFKLDRERRRADGETGV